MFAVLEGHIFPNCHILNRFYLAGLTLSLSLLLGKIHYLCSMQISAPNTLNNEVSFMYMQRKKRAGRKKSSTVKDVAINCSQIGHRHTIFQDSWGVSWRKVWRRNSLYIQSIHFCQMSVSNVKFLYDTSCSHTLLSIIGRKLLSIQNLVLSGKRVT